eukprot:95504-Chlamydomonas_euryale.AAC.1
MSSIPADLTGSRAPTPDVFQTCRLANLAMPAVVPLWPWPASLTACRLSTLAMASLPDRPSRERPVCSHTSLGTHLLMPSWKPSQVWWFRQEALRSGE